MKTTTAGVKSYHEHMREIGFLRVWPGLHPAILRAGAAIPYRMWLLIRHHDADGRGVVDTRRFLKSLYLDGITRAHLRTADAKQRAIFGRDVFFTVDGDRIHYRSLESVAAALAAAPSRSAYILKPGVRHLETFNAQIYAAWIGAGDGPKMASRARLEEIFGVSGQTLRRWEGIAGVDVTFNVVEVKLADAEIAARYIVEDDRPHKAEAASPIIEARLRLENATKAQPGHAEARPAGYVFERDGRIFYRTVNTYTHKYVSGRTGRAKKAAKAAHRAAAGLLSDAGETHDKRLRIFFDARRLNGRRAEDFVTGASVHAQADATGRQPAIRIQHGHAVLWQFSRSKPAEWRF